MSSFFQWAKKEKVRLLEASLGRKKAVPGIKQARLLSCKQSHRSCRDLFRESMPQTGFQRRCEWQVAYKCPLPCCKVHQMQWLYLGCKSYTKPLTKIQVGQLGMEDFCYFDFLLKLVLEEPLIRVQLSLKLWAETSETGPSLLTCLAPQMRYVPCM